MPEIRRKLEAQGIILPVTTARIGAQPKPDETSD
jgi:hypothetical protein